MPVPNYTIQSQAPMPSFIGDLWFDTTNQVLNVFTSGVGVGGAAAYVPITTPAISAALNASTSTPARLLLVPMVVGSLGFSANPVLPPGHAGIVYDPVGKRIYTIGSGGVVDGSVLFA